MKSTKKFIALTLLLLTVIISVPAAALTAIYADDTVEAARGTSIDLYLIAGQSNASGTSKIEDANAAYAVAPELKNGFSHVLYAGKGTYSASGSLNYDWGPTKLGMGKDTNHIGPEAGMAAALSEYYNAETGKIAGILKYAHGGSKLSGNDTDSNNWVSPSYADAFGWEYGGTTGGHYEMFLQVFREKVSDLVEMGYTDINIKGIYWMQGEGDRNDNKTESPESYYVTALEYLIGDLRADLSEIMTEVYATDDGGAADMPFYIGAISESYLLNLSNRHGINKKFIGLQKLVADSVENCYFIDNSQYKISEYDAASNTAIPLGSDTGHWKQADMLTIGQTVGFDMYNYGVIPDKYVSAEDYPFAIFCEGEFVNYGTTWGNVSRLAREYLDKNPGKTVSAVLRKDMTNNSPSDENRLGFMNGTFVFDLGGHTLTTEATFIASTVSANYTGSYDSAFVLKNGQVLIGKGGSLVYAQQGSTYDKNIELTLENVTVGAAEDFARDQVFQTVNAPNTVTEPGMLNLSVTVNNCIFDLSGMSEWGVSNSKTVSVFRFNRTGLSASVTVNGGSIKTDSFEKISLFNLNSARDSVVFGKNAYGSYTTISVPEAYTMPSVTVKLDDGTEATFKNTGKVAEGKAVYGLACDVETKYGSIPYAEASKTFALFMNGRFLGAVNTWKEANNLARTTLASNNGVTVDILMLKDRTVTESIAIADRIIFMNGTVNVDLGGNTIIAAKTLFEGGLHSSYSGSYNTVYKVSNGTVLSGAGFIFATESRGNTDKKFDLVFEDVTFGIDTATFATSRNRMFLSYNDSADYDGRLDLGLSFTDCTFELGNIPVAYTVFNFPNTPDDVYVNIAINGGSVVTDNFDDITFAKYDCNDTVTFGKGSDGAYTTVVTDEGAALPNIGGVNGMGKGVAFESGVTADGKTTYTLTENDQWTKYGYIPDDYASVSDYPFALFAKGSFNTASKTWGAAINAARAYLSSNKGGKVYIVMRADHTNTASSDYLGRIMGDVIIDLNGYTLVRGGGRSLFEAGTKGMTEAESGYEANVTVINGTMLAFNTSSSNSGHMITYQTYVNFDKTINLTFDGVTFGVASDFYADKGLYSVIVRSWGASGGATGRINSNLTFKDCTFDFSGENGTWKPTSATRLISVSAGKTSSDINVIFEGGRYTGDTSKVTYLDIDSSDSVNYVMNAEGRYTEFDITAGNPPTSAQNTDNGTMYFVRESWKNNSAGVRVYHYELGVKVDGYCTVPYVYYADPETYPFIVAQNGGFVAACTDWNKALSKAADYLDNEGDTKSVVTVWLRRDYTQTEGAAQLSRIRGKLIVDLGGNTFTAQKTMLEMEARHAHTTTVEIKNGSIISERTGTGSLIAFNRNNTAGAGDGTYNGTAHKDAYITFDGVTFALANGATTSNFITVAWNDPAKSAEETMSVYLTLNNCVIDLATVKPAGNINLFNGADGEGFIDLHVVMNGGRIMLESAEKITFLKANEGEDSFTFGKYENAYTALTIASGVAPTEKFTTAEGEMVFVATDVAGEFALTEAHTHSYTASVTAPTCTADGYTTYTCTCGDTYTDNVVPALGHKYDNDFDADCNICGETRPIEIVTSGEVSRKIFWAFEDGVLTITGRGKIKNFSAGVTPWSHLADKITKIVIGEGITYIGSSAFYCCANIESVELPETLTAMGNYVFYGCSSLKAITIPEAVTEIGKYSFRRSGLETIDFGIGYGWSAGDREFTIADIISGGHRFISKSYYKQTWVRNTEAAVETLDPNYVAGGIMHTDVIWELTDIGNGNLKLTLRGNGAMADYGTAGAPWYAYWEKITEIEIQEGVTTVGRCAFYGLKFVRKVTVASTVTSIGDYGFYMCRLLKSIELPGNVTIGKDAFVKTGVTV